MSKDKARHREEANRWYRKHRKKVLAKQRRKYAAAGKTEKAERANKAKRYWAKNRDRESAKRAAKAAIERRLDKDTVLQMTSAGLSITTNPNPQTRWIGPGMYREKELEAAADKLLADAATAAAEPERQNP